MLWGTAQDMGLLAFYRNLGALRRETAAEMALRDPQTQVVEIPGVGHAPMFMHADQVALVRAYLLNTPP